MVCVALSVIGSLDPQIDKQYMSFHTIIVKLRIRVVGKSFGFTFPATLILFVRSLDMTTKDYVSFRT